MCLGSSLHEAAERNPRKTASICGEERLSYAELDGSVTQLAGWLLGQGLAAGDRVAIHSANSIPAVQLMFACFRAGLAAVPVNMRLKAPEMAYVLEHSQTSMCYSPPALAAIAQEAAETLPVRVFSELPELVDGATPHPPLSDDAIAAVMYTSGTTARPKGVTHTHGSFAHAAELMRICGVDGDQVVLLMTSLMHASGLFFQTIPTLIQGGTLAIAPAFDAAAVLDAMERHGITFTAALPAMAQHLVAEQSARPRDTGALRLIYSGGDCVPLSLQARFEESFGLPLREIYGMTEHGPTTCNVAGAERAGSMGRLLGDVEGRVIALDGGDAAPGETGELAVRSAAAFTGYWDDPQATADSLCDGWVMTGDLVRCDADGYYWFEGRRKQLIIRGGSNISPQEVEEALYRHPAVFEAGVIGMPCPVFNEKVVACVSLKPGHSATEEEIRAFARTLLADYKTPEEIRFMAELPKGPTGKVLRRALREEALAAGA